MNKKTIRTLNSLLKDGYILPSEMDSLEKVINTFSMAIPENVYELIDKNDQNDPIRKQFIPSTEELNITPLESNDPIGDEVHQVVKGIIHRYSDRCLFLPVQVCPMYCRFCFRRETVSKSDKTLNHIELETAYHYIEEHKEIWEVIITGGDPLILKPVQLQLILQRLNSIHHVEVIRIHTRVPVLTPLRINQELLAALTSKKALFIAIHANHTNEFSEEAENALLKLVNAGIPLVSQTVLLKGINDDIHSLSNLMRTFVKNRVKPYYLHHADLAKGTSHFRTTIEKGQSLMRQLRGQFSGLCQPTYVLDIPGGFGKVPIGPPYLERDDSNSERCKCTVKDYQGNVHQY